MLLMALSLPLSISQYLRDSSVYLLGALSALVVGWCGDFEGILGHKGCRYFGFNNWFMLTMPPCLYIPLSLSLSLSLCLCLLYAACAVEFLLCLN